MVNKDPISASGKLYLWLCGVFDDYLKEVEFNHPLRIQIRPQIHLSLLTLVPWPQDVPDAFCNDTLSSHRDQLPKPNLLQDLLRRRGRFISAGVHPGPHFACFSSSAVNDGARWRKIALYFMSALGRHQGTVPSVICSRLCLLIKREGQLADGLWGAHGSSLSCN